MMIKAYMIYLGSNMWHDWDSEMPHGKNDPRYHRTMFTQKSAWRKIIDALPQHGVNTVLIDLAEGVQYESVSGISCDGAWSKAELKEELAHIRDLGMTPIPKFNFATTHDAWFGEYARMVSTPEYYRAVEELLNEVMELFDYPEFMHLGLEEELPHCQNHYGIGITRNESVFWKDVHFLLDVVRSKGVRPWIWGDGFWYQKEAFLKNIAKDVLVSNYMYVRLHEVKILNDWHVESIGAFRTVAENGYDYLPIVSTCARELNARDIMSYILETCPQDNLKGFIAAPWCRTSEDDVYCHYNEMARFSTAFQKVYGV